MVKKGEKVEIEYIGSVEGTNEVFDLTNEEDAKRAGLYEEKRKYGPITVVVGKDMVLPRVDNKLEEMEVGEEREFVVPMEEAYGRRDAKLIKIVNINKFFEQKINPAPGDYVFVEGRQAKIQSVSGGRVVVDYNHPLAGKNLRYRLKILRKVAEEEKKVAGKGEAEQENQEKEQKTQSR